MTKCASTTVTDSHFTVDFNDGYFVYEINGVGTVFTQFVLHINEKERCDEVVSGRKISLMS